MKTNKLRRSAILIITTARVLYPLINIFKIKMFVIVHGYPP